MSDLAAGQAAAALDELHKLHAHGLADGRARACRQIGQLMQESSLAAVRGHFAEAATMASRAETLAKSHTTGPGTMERIAKRLSDESAKLSRQAGDCQRLSAEMHAALSAENWSVARALRRDPGYRTAARRRDPARRRACVRGGNGCHAAIPRRAARRVCFA